MLNFWEGSRSFAQEAGLWKGGCICDSGDLREETSTAYHFIPCVAGWETMSVDLTEPDAQFRPSGQLLTESYWSEANIFLLATSQTNHHENLFAFSSLTVTLSSPYHIWHFMKERRNQDRQSWFICSSSDKNTEKENVNLAPHRKWGSIIPASLPQTELRFYLQEREKPELYVDRKARLSKIQFCGIDKMVAAHLELSLPPVSGVVCHKLALSPWSGLAYICRETETVRKN